MQDNKRIAVEILKYLLLASLVAIACTNPRFGSLMARDFMKQMKRKKEFSKKYDEKFYNAFYYLKKNGLIDIEYKGNQMYFTLTNEGVKRAEKYKINDLKIKKPAYWDKKWRILIFDIQDKHKIKREALRGKLKELGLFHLQKSVWVCPYEFRKQMEILRDFFGLTSVEMKIIIACEIEKDASVKEFFGLKK